MHPYMRKSRLKSAKRLIFLRVLFGILDKLREAGHLPMLRRPYPDSFGKSEPVHGLRTPAGGRLAAAHGRGGGHSQTIARKSGWSYASNFGPYKRRGRVSSPPLVSLGILPKNLLVQCASSFPQKSPMHHWGVYSSTKQRLRRAVLFWF